MRAALRGVVIAFGFALLTGCSDSTPTTTTGGNTNAPAPQDSGADKAANKTTGGGRIPKPK
jgi:hypothetical protein